MIKHIVLILILLTASSAYASDNETIFNESDVGFSKLYVDGFGVNSNGFTLILRTYERLQGTRFKPFLVDVEYSLTTQGKVIYSKRVEQITLPDENEGISKLTDYPRVALEEGKNYTGMARVYLYRQGVPEYYLTTSSSFTARNDAEITEVFGDGIGASATLKSKSMVPLNAKIIFTLKQDEKIIETREALAPVIMSNEKEKTVNILWTNSLNEGTYMVSAILEGKDIIDRHDKTFTVEKRTLAPANATRQAAKTAPGLTSFSAIMAVLILVLRRKNAA
ncbi:MAG: hypothetical protein O8C62_05865 [Candidatus Methanoperedens sp.]|nr:hypothetical protein [Candidatus Methanoperedens sp.]